MIYRVSYKRIIHNVFILIIFVFLYGHNFLSPSLTSIKSGQMKAELCLELILDVQTTIFTSLFFRANFFIIGTILTLFKVFLNLIFIVIFIFQTEICSTIFRILLIL